MTPRTVEVGWNGRPEQGTITCDVLKTRHSNLLDYPTLTVQWASGRPAKTVWSHSRQSYVFAGEHRK